MDSTSELVTPSDQPSYVLHPNHKAQENRAILLLLFFSFLMISLPFGAYFGAQLVLSKFGVNGFTNVVWSVSAAVLTVNLIIAGYIYMAFKEQEYNDDGTPIEDKPKSE
ncbi:hypothetical protein HHI36_009245 [Cryptolaemus montrouzieri]|uniref:Vacuolar ATPase assembly integral membrane protein VMA21 n=1 Tax=Cryptolaemus montrouzieri TaxID=559131 RepID=A0ABD2MUT1_9CUCU